MRVKSQSNSPPSIAFCYQPRHSPLSARHLCQVRLARNIPRSAIPAHAPLPLEPLAHRATVAIGPMSPLSYQDSQRRVRDAGWERRMKRPRLQSPRFKVLYGALRVAV